MLAGVLSRLNRQRILVLGDLMLDRYTWGVVKRVSPEAPVTVLQVQREDNRAGGAGNAILNLLALGQEVVAVGRVGSDLEGEWLCADLQKAGADLSGVVIQPDYPTPLKNRLVATNQQIVRVDRETVGPLPQELQQHLLSRLSLLLEGVAAVAISDYGKGFLSRVLLSEVITRARSQGIPIIVDPKGRDFLPYSGATVIKPNLLEAIEASGLHDESLDRVAERLLSLTQAQYLMVTRSEKGISLFGPDQTRQDFATEVQEVRDVTGAGDVVLAVVVAAVANGLPMEAAAELANVAGARSVAHFGCNQVSLSDLARDLLSRDGTHKVFADDHLFALKHALRHSPYALIRLAEQESLSAAFLRRLREFRDVDVVVHVEGGRRDSDFVAALASLTEVDFILLKESCAAQLMGELPPSRVLDFCL